MLNFAPAASHPACPAAPMSTLPLQRWTHRLPAHVVNGITVALGIGLIHLLFSWVADPHAAQLVVSGAIYTSLADLPDTPDRSWRRVFAAAALGCAATLLISLLKPFVLALGAGITLIVFGAMMTLAWGPRAGPVSFAPVLAIVFTMSLPPGQEPLRLVVWHLLGALVYLLWSLAIVVWLQTRYRSLALAAALSATARLLRSRAGVLEGATGSGAESGALQDWVRDEAALAERLQTARDLLFAAPDTPRARRETAVLLRTIDLRDILLASSLDLDLLGDDAVARDVRARLALQLRQMAEALDAAQAVLCGAAPMPAPAHRQGTLDSAFGDVKLSVDDARARLLPALVNRVKHLWNDVDHIDALLRGEQEDLPLSRDELQLFVAPEGWPLGALRPHASLASPVFRHALRAALALGFAYYAALALPWASHPQWLVLSVAVVLRGNLQQTLARRNLRVLGTVLGCLIVLLLAYVPSADALMLVFLIAIGFAHGFVVERYLVTAVAATVMALLQAHLVDPGSGFAVAERLGDTFLGALLAWGFSFVLPFWERRSLPQAIVRALQALQDYARHALRTDAGCAVVQRLARRQAYDALGVLVTALQRSAAEPARVRPPVRELAMLLDHGQRLMAHLSMVRLMLTRRSAELDRPEATAALQTADAALNAALVPPGSAATGPAGANAPVLERLPAEPPRQDPLPWLLWRLQLTVHDGSEAARAARSALTLLAERSAAAHRRPRK